MAQDLSHLGIIDLDEKHAIHCRHVGGRGPLFTLLWRTKGKRGKPLPKVGQYLTLPGVGMVRVVSIDPPGTHLDVESPQPGKGTLIITPHAPKVRNQGEE